MMEVCTCCIGLGPIAQKHTILVGCNLKLFKPCFSMVSIIHLCILIYMTHIKQFL